MTRTALDYADDFCRVCFHSMEDHTDMRLPCSDNCWQCRFNRYESS